MSLRLDDLVVGATLLAAAWAFYALGFRARSWQAGVALLGLPALVGLGCRLWLYPIVEAAEWPQVVGAAPAIAAYLSVGWIAYRHIGGLTYRLGAQPDRFGQVLQRADQDMQRAYNEKPAADASGRMPVEPLRMRLEGALTVFRALQPPSDAWRSLIDQRIQLHEAFIDVLTAPSPVVPEVLEPLEQRSREWMREVQELTAAEEAEGFVDSDRAGG